MWGGYLVADDLDDGRPPQMSRWRGDIMRLAIFSHPRYPRCARWVRMLHGHRLTSGERRGWARFSI